MGLWAGTAIAVIILMVVWAVGAADSVPTSPLRGALRVLDERLASGEIDPGEYRERRAVLDQLR